MSKLIAKVREVQSLANITLLGKINRSISKIEDFCEWGANKFL